MSCLIDKYSKEELSEIVNNCFTYSDVLRKIGYSTKSGNNILTLKKRIEHFGISTEHFTNNNVNRDIKEKDVFCENSKVSQITLRRFCIKKNIMDYKCSICGQEPFWNNKPLTLTLDHINGKNKDNRKENLRWICPNCDRQLSTYCAKNIKKLDKKNIKDILDNKKINKTYKTAIPEREELKQNLYKFKNYTLVSSIYDVSSTQIRRWCEKYGLPKSINVIKHTSENGWKKEEWNDIHNEEIKKIDNRKRCLMIDANTNEILKSFDSISSASIFINRPNGTAHISKVCIGERNIAYGYKWKYE